MKNDNFLEQSRRDKTHEVQLTPYKRSAVWGRTVVIMLLAVLATACNKPEKKLLEGTWKWNRITGRIAGVNLTPETEGFHAEIVFKGGTFTFYKDGKKITSGAYQVDDFEEYEDEDEMPDPGMSLYSSIHFPEAQCKKIAEATDYTINLLPSKLRARLYICGDYGELSLDNPDMYDGFIYTFVKPDLCQPMVNAVSPGRQQGERSEPWEYRNN